MPSCRGALAALQRVMLGEATDWYQAMRQRPLEVVT